MNNVTDRMVEAAVNAWVEAEPGRSMRAAIEAALREQPAPEPVAWQWLDTAHFRKSIPKHADASAWRPLYAQSGPLPWASHSRDLPVNPADGQDYGHLAGDKPAPDAQVDPVVWMSRADWDNGREPSPVYSQPQAGDDVPLYANPPQPDAACRIGQRVPLTKEELHGLLVKIDPNTQRLPAGFVLFARAVERAHGIGGKE